MANFFEERAKSLGKSEYDVAAELRQLEHRITPQAVRHWLNGNCIPRMGLVDSLAKVFKVTPERILRAMHEMAQPKASAK